MPDDPLVERVLRGRTPAEAAPRLRPRDEAGRRRRPSQARRGRHEGDRGLRRPDDQAGPGGRRRGPGGCARSRRTRSRASRPPTTRSSPGPCFEAKGDAIYPDATFTLRLAFGVVKGYEVDGKAIPPYTTIGGASSTPSPTAIRRLTSCPGAGSRPASRGSSASRRRSTSCRPPTSSAATRAARWSTAQNEVVGLIFDGNIQSLVLDFGYDERQARAVSVNSRGIVEALRSIYHADRLVEEYG